MTFRPSSSITQHKCRPNLSQCPARRIRRLSSHRERRKGDENTNECRGNWGKNKHVICSSTWIIISFAELNKFNPIAKWPCGKCLTADRFDCLDDVGRDTCVYLCVCVCMFGRGKKVAHFFRVACFPATVPYAPGYTHSLTLTLHRLQEDFKAKKVFLSLSGRQKFQKLLKPLYDYISHFYSPKKHIL